MKKCPVCGSRKFDGNPRIGWHCRRCHYKNIPEHIRNHKSNNDRVDIEPRISTQTDMNSPLFNKIYDLHNNAYKFKILKDKCINVPRQPGFKGKIYRFIFKGHKIAKTSKWLIVYHDKRIKVPLKVLKDKENEILQEISHLAIEISHEYGFDIDPTPILYSSNRPEVKTPFLSAVNFVEKEAKAVYPVPSPIEMNGSNAVQNSMNLTTLLVKFNETMEREIHNKQLHQNVLEEMSSTLKDISTEVKRKKSGPLTNVLTFLKGWFK